MKWDLSVADPEVPFSIVRALLLRCDREQHTNLFNDVHARAASIRPGSAGESLSERQEPTGQIRFFARERVERGLRYVMGQIAHHYPSGIELILPGIPTGIDRHVLTFLGWPLTITREQSSLHPREQQGDCPVTQDTQFRILRDSVVDIDVASLTPPLERLLSVGDSWSVEIIADAYLAKRSGVPHELCEPFALAFALAHRTGEARTLLMRRVGEYTVDDARARYSIAMLSLRHDPPALADRDDAPTQLDTAYSILRELPASDVTEFESIFNRNGFALWLFRVGRLDEAAELLESAIKKLDALARNWSLHRSVLINNLGRVYEALNRTSDAERALRTAISLDPQFADYHVDLAQLLVRQQRWDEAHSVIAHSITLDPARAESLRLQGFVSTKLELFEAAVDHYQKAGKLGDVDATLDALRTAVRLNSPQRVLEIIASCPLFRCTGEDLAEATLIGCTARASLSGRTLTYSEVAALEDRFPHSSIIRVNRVALETADKIGPIPRSHDPANDV